MRCCVVVTLCICVFVYVLSCVYVELCICIFVYLDVCVFVELLGVLSCIFI